MQFRANLFLITLHLNLKKTKRFAYNRQLKSKFFLEFLPTGFGKSLIFQLLPWVLKGKLYLEHSIIGHFRVALNLIMKARLSAKFFIAKISFQSYANKTNFHMKSFALSLSFMMRFTATRKPCLPAGVINEGEG